MTGRIIGGNLGTLNLLQGTGYMPSLDGALLMIEDDATSDADTFARNLTSLLQLPDASKAQALPAGSFFVMAPGMVHTAFADEDTVVQLNSTGPWGITYVNPKDDPRQKTQ